MIETSQPRFCQSFRNILSHNIKVGGRETSNLSGGRWYCCNITIGWHLEDFCCSLLRLKSPFLQAPQSLRGTEAVFSIPGNLFFGLFFSVDFTDFFFFYRFSFEKCPHIKYKIHGKRRYFVFLLMFCLDRDSRYVQTSNDNVERNSILRLLSVTYVSWWELMSTE